MPAKPRRAPTPPRRRSASGASRCTGIDTEPKATQQLLDDANVDIEAWLAGKVADKIGRFENAEFVTGAANKIRGFMAGLHATPTPAPA
jgi:HK97 family phage major capsid protein